MNEHVSRVSRAHTSAGAGEPATAMPIVEGAGAPWAGGKAGAGALATLKGLGLLAGACAHSQLPGHGIGA